MKTSDAVVEIMPALIAFQAEVQPIIKDTLNPHLKSKFANYADIRSEINPYLSKHNLFACHFVDYLDGRVIVETVVFHKSGQWIATSVSLRPDKDTCQAVGSTITYGKRYTILALLGLSDKESDDDGETAVGRGQKSFAFDPKNLKSVEWMEGVLASKNIPKEQWHGIVSSMKGLNVDEINERMKSLRK